MICISKSTSQVHKKKPSIPLHIYTCHQCCLISERKMPVEQRGVVYRSWSIHCHISRSMHLRRGKIAFVGAPNTTLPLLAVVLIYLANFCPHVCSLATTVPHNASENDRKALLCLRSHLSDPARALVSWGNKSFQFCHWRGVTCSTRHAGRVVALDLESLNITGQIFPCIVDLLFLSRIHMVDNQINGPIPSEIGRLTQLKYLNLSMNSITGVIPDTISSCSRIQVIDLSMNSITGVIPNTISSCSPLEVIDLAIIQSQV